MQKVSLKNSTYHDPVLLTEAVDWLNVSPGHKYVDATLGGGGHAREIIARGGLVLGLDQDPEAIQACPDLDGLTKVLTNFTHLADVAIKSGWQDAAGILFDLGMSQHQARTGYRGFSFQEAGPLDMRMGSSAVSAAELINHLPFDHLIKIFRDFGEIPVAKHLAAKIVAARPIMTTDQLAKLCGKWSRQAFQALRIAVNDELGAVSQALPQALEVLGPRGRIVVISFHSLEDRLVKNQFLAWQKQGQVLTPKPLLGERGSKLRAFEKK